MFGFVLHKSGGPEFPQGARFGAEAGKEDPAIPHESLDSRVVMYHALESLPCCFNDDGQARGFMDLDHLPRKARTQVALCAIHHTQE